MVQINKSASKAILGLLRRHKNGMTPNQLLDHFCPPPKFTVMQIQDTLAYLIQKGAIEFTDKRVIRRK